MARNGVVEHQSAAIDTDWYLALIACACSEVCSTQLLLLFYVHRIAILYDVEKFNAAALCGILIEISSYVIPGQKMRLRLFVEILMDLCSQVL